MTSISMISIQYTKLEKHGGEAQVDISLMQEMFL
jgi:hypothetical protein